MSTPRRPESHPSMGVRLVTPPRRSRLKSLRREESIGETPVRARGHPPAATGSAPGWPIGSDGHADRRSPADRRGSTSVVPSLRLDLRLPPLPPSAHAGRLLSRPPEAAGCARCAVRRTGGGGPGQQGRAAPDVGRADPAGRRGQPHGAGRLRVPPHLVPRLDQGGAHPGCRARRPRLATLPRRRRRRAAGRRQPAVAGVHDQGHRRPRPPRPRAPRRRQRAVVPERSRHGGRGPVGVGAAGRRPVLARSARLVGVGRRRRRR